MGRFDWGWTTPEGAGNESKDQDPDSPAPDPEWDVKRKEKTSQKASQWDTPRVHAKLGREPKRRQIRDSVI
jgi:hypothetical protein